MKIVNAMNVYSYILDEMEWYAVPEDARQATIANCMQGAWAADCQYAAILVEPDAVMSVSPFPTRHQVWRHTFPTSAEHAFKVALSEILHETTLDHKAIKAILRTYMESYGE